RSDPGKYRKPGELDAWRERDPLKLAGTALRERFGARDADLEAEEASVEDEIAAIVERGLAAPYPSADAPVAEFKA
ncbi:MAG: ABC transporter substrate-binding protein, partial [Solirubrobacteraceae bacterium]